MINVLDIAQYFIAMDDVDGVSNIKLQKLLYYAQGGFLAIFDKPLFKENIEAWRHGPVVPDVYHYYKNHGGSPIILDGFDGAFFDEMTQEEKEIIQEVQDCYGGFSAWKLRDMTHQDACWKNNYIAENPTKIIPLDEIKSTFSSKVVGSVVFCENANFRYCNPDHTSGYLQFEEVKHNHDDFKALEQMLQQS